MSESNGAKKPGMPIDVVIRRMTGWGVERSKGLVCKMTDEEKKRLLVAYETRTNARGVLSNIRDRIADQNGAVPKPTDTSKSDKAGGNQADEK